MGDFPARRARRLVADDRRPGARSAHQVLRHVLPGRLEAQPQDHAEPRASATITNRHGTIPQHNFSQGLDLSAAGSGDDRRIRRRCRRQATAIVGNNYWKWNGLWQWTSSSHPGMWNAPKLALQPRAGIAIRVDDKTRFGPAMPGTRSPRSSTSAASPGLKPSVSWSRRISASPAIRTPLRCCRACRSRPSRLRSRRRIRCFRFSAKAPERTSAAARTARCSGTTRT